MMKFKTILFLLFLLNSIYTVAQSINKTLSGILVIEVKYFDNLRLADHGPINESEPVFMFYQSVEEAINEISWTRANQLKSISREFSPGIDLYPSSDLRSTSFGRSLLSRDSSIDIVPSIKAYSELVNVKNIYKPQRKIGWEGTQYYLFKISIEVIDGNAIKKWFGDCQFDSIRNFGLWRCPCYFNALDVDQFYPLGFVTFDK